MTHPNLLGTPQEQAAAQTQLEVLELGLGQQDGGGQGGCLPPGREERGQIQHHTAVYREQSQRSAHDRTEAHRACHQIQAMPPHPGDSLVSDTGLCAGEQPLQGAQPEESRPHLSAVTGLIKVL